MQAVRWATAPLALVWMAGCSSASGGGAATGPADGGKADAGMALVCYPQRPATAFSGGADGGVAAAPPAGEAPTPCLTLTGFGASESSIGIDREGTVFFAPANATSGNGVVRSHDDGMTWDLLVPEIPDGGGHTRLEPYLYVDPTSDEVYFATSKLVLNGITSFKDDPGIHLSVSADHGDTWTYASMAPHSRDWEKIFSTPFARAAGAAALPVYFSAPSPIAGNWAGIFPPPDFQYVYKSTDGGQTWQQAGTLPINPAMLQDCSADDYAMFGEGAVAADGTVYLGYRLCTHLAVAVSHDEGATWTTREIPGATLPPYKASSPLSILGNENAITGEPITLDSAGNLYAVWEDVSAVLHFSTSRDGGMTWSAPVVAMDPAVQSGRFAAVATRAPGVAAIAYFGTTDGKRFNGYIAETQNAFDASPTFWSASVNDPDDPLYPSGFASGYDVNYFSNGGLGVEFVTVKYAPNGDIWAAFVKDMCPNGTCTWDLGRHANSRFQGAAGRLVHH
jgi:hypothetical protein